VILDGSVDCGVATVPPKSPKSQGVMTRILQASGREGNEGECRKIDEPYWGDAIFWGSEKAMLGRPADGSPISWGKRHLVVALFC
jgi:hypothetical protein